MEVVSEQSSRTRISGSFGCMISIGEFLHRKEVCYLQQVSKRFYTHLVPFIPVKVVIFKPEEPDAWLVLENKRQQLSVGYWYEEERDLR